jgi:hypothetical protein
MQRRINICAKMPPKRPLSNHNDYQSPPPGHRPTLANEHHLSPLPGRLPDTPVDAPVAINTPPRIIDCNSETLTPTIGRSPEHIQETPAVVANPNSRPAAAAEIAMEAGRPEMQNSAAVAIESGALGGGGARAAYHASQQQRVVTCNLNSIAPSE